MRSMWRIILSVFFRILCVYTHSLSFFMLYANIPIINIYPSFDHNNLYGCGDGLRFLWIFGIKKGGIRLELKEKKESEIIHSTHSILRTKWFYLQHWNTNNSFEMASLRKGFYGLVSIFYMISHFTSLSSVYISNNV